MKTADSTAQLAQLATFSRYKLTADVEAKRSDERMAGNGEQQGKASANSRLERDELAEARKTAEQAVASTQQALEEPHLAK